MIATARVATAIRVHLVVLAHLVVAQQLQTSGDRHLVDVVERKVGHREVVPSAGEAEQEDDDQNRADGRQHDAVKIWKSVAPSISAGLVQFPSGCPSAKLQHQEDVATLPRPGMMQAQ